MTSSRYVGVLCDLLEFRGHDQGEIHLSVLGEILVGEAKVQL